jgi:endonuclease V-like protein UPF0215 family
MTRKLSVKREIRTLGLDFCDPRRLVGAVIRGGLYIDGVVVFPTTHIPRNGSIASAILGTRFFPELRVIMTHDPQVRLESRVLERLTKLPVIQVDSKRRKRSDGFDPCSVEGKKLYAKSLLPPKTVQEIFLTTWTIGTLPEPLRVAHLIARSRFFGENKRFQANK